MSRFELRALARRAHAMRGAIFLSQARTVQLAWLHTDFHSQAHRSASVHRGAAADGRRISRSTSNLYGSSLSDFSSSVGSGMKVSLPVMIWLTLVEPFTTNCH